MLFDGYHHLLLLLLLLLYPRAQWRSRPGVLERLRRFRNTFEVKQGVERARRGLGAGFRV
jgi:hypothetical protein